MKIAHKKLWGRANEIIAMVQKARDEGYDIRANVYPYTAGQNNLSSIVPPWAHDGGREKMLERLKDPAARKRMREEVMNGLPNWYNHYLATGDGWAGMLLVSLKNERNKPFQGKRMSELIAARGGHPADVLFDVLLEEGGSVPTVFFHHSEPDMQLILKQPWTSIGSDGSAVSPDGPTGRTHPHPRYYGTFPRVLGRYVRELKVITLPEAVKKMTSMLTRIPVGRRVSDTLYLAPGVSSGGTVGQANPSMSGGSGLDNQYVIDGVNVTNSGYGALGSYSIVFGSLGNATPFDFIKDVQVKTGGYEAEFGQATGGVVNVITKSGSNAFKGSGFYYDRPSGLEGTWTQVQTPNGTVQTTGSRSYDGGAEGGGPILKDRVFFFGAFDPSRDVRTFQAPAAFPLLSLGDLDRTRDSFTYATKATVQIKNGQQIDASFFGDPSNGLNGPQRASALLNQTTAGFSSLDYGGHNQTVRYSGTVRPNLLLEGYFAHALNNLTETPSVDAWEVNDRTVTPNVTTGGIGGYEANRSDSWQYAAKATSYLGQHELRYGFEYDHAASQRPRRRTQAQGGRSVGEADLFDDESGS